MFLSNVLTGNVLGNHSKFALRFISCLRHSNKDICKVLALDCNLFLIIFRCCIIRWKYCKYRFWFIYGPMDSYDIDIWIPDQQLRYFHIFFQIHQSALEKHFSNAGSVGHKLKCILFQSIVLPKVKSKYLQHVGCL